MQIKKGKSLVTVPLRFFFYLCLSTSLTFLSGFLVTSQTVTSEGEFIFIERYDKPANQITAHQYRVNCDSKVIDGEQGHILDLQFLHNSSKIPASSWEEIREKIFGDKQDKLCLIEKDNIYAVKARRDTVSSPMEPMVMIDFENLGSWEESGQYPVLTSNQFGQYREIEKVLVDIALRPDYERTRLKYEPADIDLQEWKIFTGSVPGLDFNSTAFIFDNYLFEVKVKKAFQQVEKEIPGLKKKYTIGGIILLAVGLLVMPKLYRSVKGVKLISNKFVFLLDCIIIIILSVLGFMGMDHFLAEKTGTISLLGREGLLGGFTYVPIILIMPIIVSWKSARGIFINKEGILDSDLLLQAFMPWNELSRLELMEDIEFSGRRRTYKVLFFHAIDENAINISGNISTKAKQEIKALLMKYVPEKWKNELKQHLRVL